MYLRTISSSPSHPGHYYESPRYFNPRLADFTSCTIDLDQNHAMQLISELNTQVTQRSFEFQNPKEQLELLRLETTRRKILGNMTVQPDLPGRKPTQGSSAQATSDNSAFGEPGPSLPITHRTRAAILSESEISVLDIGPSLHSSHNSTIASRRASATKHNKPRLLRTASPAFLAGPDSDGSDKASPVRTPLRIADLDSVAVTSASTSVSNEFPLHLRERRQEQFNITLPGPRGLRRPHDQRSFSGGHYELLGYGYGYSGFTPDPFYTPDEPDRHIHAQSVPHSPRSPSEYTRPSLPRSQSSFAGMGPEFASMRNAEQVRKTKAAKKATCEAKEDGDGQI
ncbi:uncharacterized protein N7529_010563 [Penicillium soppii]|uniref:uncharacterized protein n=1 Tax=Penicillium soppii TaxID=69789 RepID=UPI0025473751|nr:uncharacterized protein N7529_010563 [Penicillium soppii]KAJ5856619.1 hypothetical protein N7529_010563 [Penicillium soppii]